MAQTTVSAANTVQQWSEKFFTEYQRLNPFSDVTGTDSNKIIQVQNDLTKLPGEMITLPLVRKLKGSGVTGSTTLRGNEEAMIDDGHRITVDVLRNAVLVDQKNQQKTQLDLLNIARPQLMKWAVDRMRSDTVDGFMSPVVDGVTKYAVATEVQKDAWLGFNLDRVLFGSQRSNTVGTDHSASLLNVDNAADKLSAAIVNLLKRMAKVTTIGTAQAISPVMIDGRNEWFCLYVGSIPMRDLRADPVIAQANRDAWTRGRDNPIFNDDDLMYGGVIIKEVPEIPVITGVGAAGIDVAPVFLAGAQSIGQAWAMTTKPIYQVDDYDFVKGVGVMEYRGVEKLMYTSVQHGVVTGYVAAVGDT